MKLLSPIKLSGILSITILAGCYHGPEFDAQGSNNKNLFSEESLAQKIEEAAFLQEPTHEVEVVTQDITRDVVASPAKHPHMYPPTDPREFAKSIFDPTLRLTNPWQANYVGSYGLLPTRYQDKGPSLYSFEVKARHIFDDDY